MKNFGPTFPDFPHMLHGGDYNPDQWRETPEIWDEDMRLMKEANVNTMTMGIFSWCEIEPEEDVFDFSVIDTMMDKIYENGGRVILATPSASRPHWLAEKYPEVLRVDDYGRKEHYRSRHNFCASSEAYRKRIGIINRKLSERYANHPALLGWHISNEYGSALYDGFSYCDKCAAKFRQWLKEKYGTIEELNRQWWSRFWGQRYDSFDQIEVPYLEIGNQNLNALKLDWRRFGSDNILDFMKEEIKAIREYSNKPITTNCMAIYPGLNYRDFAKEVDFFSQDFYPEWNKGTKATATTLGLWSDYSRGMKDGKPFILMESAPGSAMFNLSFEKTKSSKQQALEAVKIVACGSDSVLYFQWRKGRGGLEKFHGAIVDHYGKSGTRAFKVISKTGEMLKKLDDVVGTGVHSDVAIMHDTDNWWGLGKFKRVHSDNGYMATIEAFYKAFSERNIQTDIIGPKTDFEKYKLVVIPSQYLMTEELADKIKNYVKNGGTVIATYLTAVTNINDRCNLGGVPGFGLTDVFGIRVDEVESYENNQNPRYDNFVSYKGKEYKLNGIAEGIEPNGAKMLAEYTNCFYISTGALYCNNYGNGKAYYMGFENEGEFQADFVEDIVNELKLAPSSSIKCDSGVCIRKREGDGKNFYFVMNETDEKKEITLDKNYKNMLNDEIMSGKYTLDDCGFYILTDIE